ncbi:DHH family phosphoesterase [Candidatus Pacearchaeota archaeon]|nr:DHH family phosphoesterase [Candidatus Pacearchaeota archaeon]
MLNSTQLQEIRNQLETSQNPLFFYDNDVDGLCSFLVLRRALDRGKGVAIKSFPELKAQYTKKIDELNPDVIIILDKAELSKEFADHAEEKGVPILWIDHHESKTPQETIQKTSYYNSHPSAEPISFIAQKIFNRPQDLWLAIIGCIGDVYTPDFAEQFAEENPDLLPKNTDAFTALQTTTIGKIARMLNFGLMDTTTNILKLIKYLFKATTPYDLLEENPYTKQFHKRVNQLEAFFQKQIQKAEAQLDKKSSLLFFTYSGNTSMSSEISNRLAFNHKDKLIVVAFLRPEKANISVRGKNALKITKTAIENILGATGGGHEKATGAMVPISDFEKFKSNIIQLTQ